MSNDEKVSLYKETYVKLKDYTCSYTSHLEIAKFFVIVTITFIVLCI